MPDLSENRYCLRSDVRNRELLIRPIRTYLCRARWLHNIVAAGHTAQRTTLFSSTWRQARK